MIHKFNIDLYKTPIYVTYDATEKEVTKLFNINEYSFPDKVNAYTYTTTTRKDNKRCIFIAFYSKKEMTAPIMGHEAIHAAMAIYEYFEMDPSGYTNEPFAYLTEYIIECCEKAKNYDKRRNKKSVNA